MSKERNLEGLGGWLILVCIGIVFAPLQIIALLLMTKEIFSDGTWEALTTPGSDAYNAYWAPFIMGEITINIFLIGVWIFIAVLFFKKHRWFPKWYIGMLVFGVIFMPLDAILASKLMPGIQVFDAETSKDFVRACVGALIWIPYMLISERVKATFVR